MRDNIVKSVPYLRRERQFSETPSELSQELTKTYIDIASNVNERTIGIHATNKGAITGETWFLEGVQKNESVRQVYTFTSATDFDHGLDFSEMQYITRVHGTYYDGTNWYGLVPTGTTAIAGQLGFYLSPTQVVFTVGAAAPTPSKGLVVIEWLSFA